MPITQCDILIQAGHENTPDSQTGGSGPIGDEIDWTPIVANEAVAILQAAGVNAIKEDASIKHTNRNYQCKLAVFVHFDDSDQGTSGPSVGYDHNSDEPAASEWKALYQEFFPFNSTWRSDNFTEDEHHYYGFSHTFTSDAEFLIEFGDIQSLAQATWLKPRLRWLGSLLAYFLSHRSGLGGVAKPSPFVETSQPGLPQVLRLQSTKFRGDSVLEAVAAGDIELQATGGRVDGTGLVQDALKALAVNGHPELDIDFGGNPNLRGFFGPKTAHAVTAFQNDQGLPQTGIVDEATIMALDAELVALQPTPPVAPDGGGQDPVPVGHAEPFSTPAASSGDTNGSSKTTGLQGTSQAFSDGTIVTDATEQLRAIRIPGLNGSLTAHWHRVQNGNTATVHQENYSYNNRMLPDAILIQTLNDFPPAVLAGFTATDVKTVKATQFGKNDHTDEGTGSPAMGTIQTNSDVVGASVKVSIMAATFGDEWRNDDRRLETLIEVYFPDTSRMVRVPLVDIGPSEMAASHAEVDLTLSCDQFLGTQGLGTVNYRMLIPT